MLFSKFKHKKSEEVLSIADGKLIPIENVKDDIFRRKLLGDGIAFLLEDETIVSPVSGIVNMIFPTGHAFGITSDTGVEFMIHIGIDTVKNKGKGFHVKVKQGDHVKAGQQLIQIDLPGLSQIYDMTTMLIITNSQEREVMFYDYGPVKKGQNIMRMVREV